MKPPFTGPPKGRPMSVMGADHVPATPPPEYEPEFTCDACGEGTTERGSVIEAGGRYGACCWRPTGTLPQHDDVIEAWSLILGVPKQSHEYARGHRVYCGWPVPVKDEGWSYVLTACLSCSEPRLVPKAKAKGRCIMTPMCKGKTQPHSELSRRPTLRQVLARRDAAPPLATPAPV